VLLEEILHFLDPQPGMTAVDCTTGWGGHASALLERLGPEGKLLGIDFDPENLPKAKERLAAIGYPFGLHCGNFAGIQQAMGSLGMLQADLLLADLGMSSMQLDEAERGFSYRRDGPLDMRMNPTRGRTAADLLATISEEELREALETIGDEPQARTIARSIVLRRAAQPIERTLDLSNIILSVTAVPHPSRGGTPSPNRWNNPPLARVFQTLRILVNRELNNLDHLLRILPDCLRSGGKVAIITFHSGEDRRVKGAFREGFRSGIYSDIAKEPIRPTAAECAENPRSRSAKLRWAVRA
jgi:16S rRNA (cytosine1402-N4)-methyltransferase